MRNLRQPFTQLLAFPSSNTHSLHNMPEYIRNIGSNEAMPLRYGANTAICKGTRGSIYLALVVSAWLGFQLAVSQLTLTHLNDLETSLVVTQRAATPTPM